jgi:opacity protein-like surface antigen
MRKMFSAAVAALALTVAPPAAAAVVTETYDFSAFVSSSYVPGNIVTGSLTVTYDNAVTTFNGSLDAFTSNIPFGSFSAANVLFIYFGPSDPRFVIGANFDANGFDYSHNDLSLIFNAGTGSNADLALIKPQVNNVDQVAFASNERVTLRSAPTGSVPEPATWAMMLLGFGGIGFRMRRRRPPVLTQIA